MILLKTSHVFMSRGKPYLPVKSVLVAIFMR